MSAIFSPDNHNPPGSSELSYRVGRHPEFFARMLEQLRKETVQSANGRRHRPLARLRTEDKDDPAIALLDAWAMTLDVLTFYQERIANEAYLKTATERLSVMELARAVGYELSPGMAAGAFLAFIVEDAPGSAGAVEISAGTKVLSVPKRQNAMPLTFETAKKFSARPQWNDLKLVTGKPIADTISLEPLVGAPSPVTGTQAAPAADADTWVRGTDFAIVLPKDISEVPKKEVKEQKEILEAIANNTRPPPPAKSSADRKPKPTHTAALRLQGVNNDLRKGDLLLVKRSGHDISSGSLTSWYAGRVQKADADHEKDLTLVHWAVPAGARAIPPDAELYAMRRRTSLFGQNAPEWNTLSNKTRLQIMLGTEIIDVVLHGSTLIAGASDGRLFRNNGGPQWKEINGVRTMAAVTALASHSESLPPLAWTIACFIQPFLFFMYIGLRHFGVGSNPFNQLIDLVDDMLKILRSAVLPDGTPVSSIKFYHVHRVSGWSWRWFSWQTRWHYTPISVERIQDMVSEATINGARVLDRLMDRIAQSTSGNTYVKELQAQVKAYRVYKKGGGFLVAGTAGEGVFISTDDGETWEKSVKGLQSMDIRGVAFDSHGNVFAKTGDGAYKCAEGSSEWKRLAGRPLVEMAAEDKAAKKKAAKKKAVAKEKAAKEGLIAEDLPLDAREFLRPDEDAIAKILTGRLAEDWPSYRLHSNQAVELDSDYTDILDDSLGVLVRDGVDGVRPALIKIGQVSTVFRRDFGVSGKVTRIEIDPAYKFNPHQFGLRDTTLYAVSERLQPALSDPTVEKEASSKDEAGAKVTDAVLQRLAKDQNFKDSKNVINALKQWKDKWGFRNKAELKAALPNIDEKQISLILQHAENIVVKLTINRIGLGLKPGQALAITGNDAQGKKLAEVAMLAKVIEDAQTTVLEFTNPIQNDYMSATISINANVVPATHGEAIEDEVLGSGDAMMPNQRFVLKRKPLTYVTTHKSTLEIRVNDVLWKESPSLYGLDENSKNYVLRDDDKGNTFVMFGDGKHGARLPSGIENVRASYRIGLGARDMPEPDSLVLLANPPQGVREVSNPALATGGADPENHVWTQRVLPRREAPHDRVVSLMDYENVAATFPGVGKAQAVTFRTPDRFLVHITLAGEKGREIPQHAKLLSDLQKAIEQRAAAGQAVQLESYRPRYFGLQAKVYFDPRFLAEKVEQAVRGALLKAFSFAEREFGQDVVESELIPVMQQVPGVIYVVFQGLSLNNKTKLTSLAAHKAHWNEQAGRVQPADLLLLDAANSSIVLSLRPHRQPG